ncbi:MAG: FkbM family methyltransferase [Candidatus Rokubacteria bacterium]|nr:FkbM family methyltransferase [Candidatus Rokubacteria bacterium]
MTFISYAQNYEDVMLFRALKGVDKGFYIDVGAQDPLFDSVTKAFYERGWRGINIEPVEHWFQKLVADRPEDINLQLAASSQTGNVRFFEVRDTGMSTADVNFARQHAAQGFEVREYEILAKPLDMICAESGVKEVHFLKVDVEGAEAEVLRGISLTDIRPHIILVEATEPNSQVTTHKQWEHLLTNRGYEFAYFDGLNRFYVATEHATLKSMFSIPPNYFDHYIRYQEWRATEHASRREAEREGLARETDGLRGQLEETRRDAETLRERVGRTEAEREGLARETDGLRGQLAEERRVATELRGTIELYYNSRSWRMTAPLRAAKRRFVLSVHILLGAWSYLVRMPREPLRAAGRRAANRPALRRLARRLMMRWPRLRWRIRQFLSVTPEASMVGLNADSLDPPRGADTPPTSNLSPAVQAPTGNHSGERVGRFAVIESMQAVVDVEALRARIRSETEHRQGQSAV